MKCEDYEWWVGKDLDVAMAYFKLLFQHLPKETEESYEKPPSE
jgi:hypothetical protein